ncbi:MAG: hypothetical protein IKS10_10900 [Lachnospiraceae bacterium]|nr:hypothetical protein [Lachnospiraceae bacterium]
MKQFLIEDIKAFTTHLFLQPTFDAFFLREAVFKTAATFSIDGAANADYFDTDEGIPEHVTWGTVRPLSFQVIKGNRLPVSFQVILYPDEAGISELIGPDAAELTAHLKVTRFYLNLSYKGRRLTCTTGTSYAEFTVDKSAEEAWDRAVRAFLSRLQIAAVEA